MDALRKKLGRKSKTVDGPRFAEGNAYGHDISDKQQRASFREELSSLATPHKKTQASRAQAPGEQADWFTAAMQNSAQLAAMAEKAPQHQAQSEAKQTAPKLASNKGQNAKHQMQAASGIVRQPILVPRDDTWFKEAMQQSSQLDHL